MIKQGRHTVTEIMLHTSATPKGWYVNKGVRAMRNEIRRWHVEGRGLSDIGYHRVFDWRGKMATGRSLYTQGAGCAGRNRGVIHLCMVPKETVGHMGVVTDFYTDVQIDSVKAYIQEIIKLHGTPLVVTGHNEFANKLCPGFIVVSEEWL